MADQPCNSRSYDIALTLSRIFFLDAMADDICVQGVLMLSKLSLPNETGQPLACLHQKSQVDKDVF